MWMWEYTKIGEKQNGKKKERGSSYAG